MSHAQAGRLRRLFDNSRRYSPVFFLALLLGVLTGTLGGMFHLLAPRLLRFRNTLAVYAETSFDGGLVVSVVLSALMLTAAVYLVRRIAPETSGSGVQEIEGALSGQRPLRWKRVLPVKFFAGLLSLGSGLVLGREGPTIQMGGAAGRMLSDFFMIDIRHVRHSLVAAGAGAGLAAAFNAPLAGILFVVEEMRRQFKFNFVSFHCVVIAATSSDIMVRLISGPQPDIVMHRFPVPDMASLVLFLVFGAVLGVIGFFFNITLTRTVDFVQRFKVHHNTLVCLGTGAFIGFLLWVYPNGAGTGDIVLRKAIAGNIAVESLLFIFILRFATTMLSYGSGAPGGIFAPMMALGTLFGLWFGEAGHQLFPEIIHHPGIFAVAGMGALFSATVRAPVTGLVLVMEMTFNYTLTLPLIITCMAATITAETFGGRPIYTVLLEKTLQREKEKAPPSE